MSEKKNDFFSFFNGPSKKKETKKIIFDENYFNLNVTGGKLHSEKIIIEAIAITDNEKLATEIKWFQISANGDFNPLTITGNSYQPSIEDVGSKFMIQVVPIKEGRQYEGMPKSMEIGPLQCDEAIQEEIDELLENEKMTVFVTLEQFLKKDFNIETELPISCILRITLKNMELDLRKNDLTIHQISIPLDASFPSCQSKQGTDSSLILKVDVNNEFLIQAADNSSRDIILTVVKGFYGKSVWKKQENIQEDEESDDNEEEDEEELQNKNEDEQINEQQNDIQQEIQQQVEITQVQQVEEKNEHIIEQQQIVQQEIISETVEQQVQIKQQTESPQKEQIVENQKVESLTQSPIKVEQHLQPEQEISQEQKILIEGNNIPQNQIESNIQENSPKNEIQQQQIGQDDQQVLNEIEQVEQKEIVKIDEIQKSPEKVEEQQPNIISVRSCSEEIVQSEIIAKQEIPKQQENQIIENENEEQIQQQKQRSEHKFQSVIVTSEAVKEEKQSPTKKKEKKTNVDLYMQINENVKLKQDIEQARIAAAKDQEQIQKQQKQLSTLSEQLANCTRNYYQLEEECANQKKIMHSLNDQKVFLQQDINMYKTQLLELTEVNQNQKEEISQLQKRLKRQAISADLNEAKKQIEQLKEEIAKKDLMLEAANQDHILAQKKIEDLEKEIEGYQNQLKHEQKKYDSLAIEKGIKQPIPGIQEKTEKTKLQFEKNIRDFKPVAQSMIQLDDASKYSIDISQSLSNLDSDAEVNRLKTQIMHLEATLRSLKIAYEQDVRYTKGKTGKGSVGSSKDIKYLQHVANNMAEIITEKDMQLENQKRINKELLTKLQILQQQ